MSESGDLGFWRTYIFSTDHKTIGKQYLFTALFMALFGIFWSILMRLQIAWPEASWPILDAIMPNLYDSGYLLPERYISLVTMHGTVMIFFVVSFALLSGFGNFIIPLQIGAKDMAYPLLNMLSYWTVVPSCFLMILSFLVEGGAAAAGWTSYPPLSALEGAMPGSGMGQTLWLLAMALFIVSFTMGSLNFVATILNLRTRGMSLLRLPLTIWTLFIASILGLLAFPTLTAAAIMLLLDRHGGTSFFLPGGLVLGEQVLPYEGGTPLLFQHLFWFLGHPEVYVLVLPAVGIAFDVIATFGRRPVFGYRTSVWSLVIIAGLSMIVWGHHMYTSGMNPYLAEYFSVATVAITIPFAVLGMNLIASLWRADIRTTSAMLFALGIVAAIGIGGLGGLWLGTATSDMYLHDSYFVVGHFHFMIGVVTAFAMFAATYYWFPKMFGRFMSERLGKLHFWLSAAPIFYAFVAMHLLGLAGHLRRLYDPAVYDVAVDTQWVNVWISAALFIAAGAQAIFFINVFWSLLRGERAPENPWEGATLEWTSGSPAPHLNWATLPVVHRWPYDYRPPSRPDGYLSQTAAEPAVPGGGGG